MHSFDGAWHMGWMWIWWIVVPVSLALVVWIVLRSARGGEPPIESPKQVLQRRYAQGEIDHDTYQRMLTDLER